MADGKGSPPKFSELGDETSLSSHRDDEGPVLRAPAMHRERLHACARALVPREVGDIARYDPLSDRADRSVVDASFRIYALKQSLGVGEDKYSAVHRREHVQPVRQHQGCRMGTSSGHDLSAVSGARIDRLDQSWLANRNMDEASRRIEESDIRNSGNRPLIAYLTRANIDFDECAVIARDVETFLLVIDIEPVRTP